MGKNCVSFDKLKIKGTIPIIKNCDLYIGNDTGWLHISAALGLNCLALFMDSPVQAYGKYSNNINVIIPDGETEETTSHDTLGGEKISFEKVLDKSIELEDYEICFSIKSNSNQSIIKTFSKLGSGADVVSIGELKRALKAGIPSKKIVFSGVGKTSEEIEYAIKNNILMFNVESISELKKISQVSKDLNIQSNISLRINPDISAGGNEKISTGKAQDKFGIDWKSTIESYDFAASLPGIKIIGIDFHIGSQINEIKPFEESLDLLVGIICELRKKGHDIKVFDIGGGLGVKYHPKEKPLDIKKYGKLLSEKLGEIECKIIIEPGRFLTANSAILVTKIIYIKNTETNNFLIVDAAMNDFIRPKLYGSYHKIITINEDKKGNLSN